MSLSRLLSFPCSQRSVSLATALSGRSSSSTALRCVLTFTPAAADASVCLCPDPSSPCLDTFPLAAMALAVWPFDLSFLMLALAPLAMLLGAGLGLAVLVLSSTISKSTSGLSTLLVRMLALVEWARLEGVCPMET